VRKKGSNSGGPRPPPRHQGGADQGVQDFSLILIRRTSCCFALGGSFEEWVQNGHLLALPPRQGRSLITSWPGLSQARISLCFSLYGWTPLTVRRDLGKRILVRFINVTTLALTRRPEGSCESKETVSSLLKGVDII